MTPKTTSAPPAGTIDCLGEGKTVGVVGQTDLTLQQCLKIQPQRLPDQPGRIGILDATVAE
jgi:hypothetical protein